MNQPKIDPSDLNKIFGALHENMEIFEVEPLELYIIGGTSMNLESHVRRATIDVDLLGVIYETSPDDRELLPEFPDKFDQCVNRVAGEFDLMENWLNFGPSGLTGALPEEIIDRSNQRVIGDRLTLYIAARIDLIYLKTHAVVNTFDSSHTDVHNQDLKSLQPSQSELIQAMNWSREIFQSTHDDYNWDNQYLHDAFQEIAQEITGEPLPENIFKPGDDSDET